MKASNARSKQSSPSLRTLVPADNFRYLDYRLVDHHNMTATQVKAREQECAERFAAFEKQMSDAVFNGVARVQRWNKWTAMMGALPPKSPAIDRIAAIRKWECDDRIAIDIAFDLCTGTHRATVRVPGLAGAIFSERSDVFPSEQLFARLALAVATRTK